MKLSRRLTLIAIALFVIIGLFIQPGNALASPAYWYLNAMPTDNLNTNGRYQYSGSTNTAAYDMRNVGGAIDEPVMEIWNTNSYAQATYYGTSIKVRMVMGSVLQQTDVYVDGSLKTTMATNTGTGYGGLGYTYTGTQAVHTVKIVPHANGRIALRSIQVSTGGDTTAPTLGTASIPGGWATSKTVSITASDSQSGLADIYCKIAADAGYTKSTTGTCSRTTAVNNDTFSYYAVDNTNLSTSVSTASVTNIDSSAPSVPSASASPSGWTSAGSVTLSASGSVDNESGISYYQYSGDLVNWYTSNPIYPTAEGTSCYYFRAVNGVGLASGASSAICSYIDRTAPSGSAWASNTGWTSGAVTVYTSGSVTGNAPYQDSRCKVGSGGAWSAYYGTASCATSANNTIYYESRDSALNTVSGSYTVSNIDTTGPILAVLGASNGAWYNNSVTATSNSNDPESGLLSQAVSSDNVNWGTTATVSAANANTIYMRATNGANTPASGTITVNINKAPTNIALSATAISENASIGTSVGTLSSTDARVGDTFTYSLVAGGPDNASFTISGSSLNAAAVFNYEAKSSYSIMVRSTDAMGLYYDKAFTITVNNLNEAPTDISLSASSLPENSVSGTTVGTLSASDPDAGSTFTYSLVAGTGSTDNASFAISGTSLNTAAVLNYEAKSSYSIRVRVTDNGSATYEEVFTINLTNVNESPTDISLSNSSVAENAVAGTTVGTLSSSDPDSGDTQSFTFTAGYPDNSYFTLAGNTLKTAAAFNFEARNSYSISVTATDGGGLSFVKSFTVSVTDVAEYAPTDINLSASSVPENSTVGTLVGTLGATDADPNSTFTYSLVAGTGSTDNGSFSISGNNLNTASVFDFETKSSYSIRVQVTDENFYTFQEALTISVTNVNEAPTDISLSATSVAENMAAGSTVGNMSATDQDAGNTFTYSLVSGTGSGDNANFIISGNNLTLDHAFNYETKSSYLIRLRVTDNTGLYFEEPFTITVTDVNESPTNIALTSSTIAENSSIGTTVGTLSATDQDTANTFTYSFVTGTGDTDNASFSITGNTLKTAAIVDYEAKSTYSIRIRVTDNTSLTYDKVFPITVTNVSEAPTDIALSASSVAENAISGTTVGTLSATDQDASSTFTYSLVSGTGSTDNASFAIVGNSLNTATVFNYEAKSSYSIRVRVTDNTSLPFEEAFTITVTNVNETPTDIALSNSSVAENAISGTTVGNLSGVDPDAGSTFTYALVAGAGSTDNASFTITGSTLKTAAVFNYETKNSYSIRVQVTDNGSLVFEKALTISVTDVAEAVPTDISLTNSSVAENSASGTTVGTLGAVDTEPGATFTYTLVSGTGSTDNASFAISGTSLNTAAVFDFETKSSYSVRVRVTDNNLATFEKALTIAVSNVNENPTAIFLSASSVAENLASNSTVGTLSATDPDSGSTFTYTLVSGTGSTDNASFAITSNSLKTAAVFNYEAKPSYSIRVRVTDNNSLTYEQAFTVTVTDVNESPSDIALTSSTVAENAASGTTVGTLSTTDPDTGNTFTYTLVSGIGSTDNSSFAITGNTLKTAAIFNFEAKSSYSIRVRVTDNPGLTYEKVFAITVTNVNETPTDIGLSVSSVAETASSGTTVGVLSSVDQDSGNTFTYTLVSGTGSADNTSFAISGSNLNTAVALDYETKSSYSIRIRTTDNTGLTFEKQITINVTYVDTTPPSAPTTVTAAPSGWTNTVPVTLSASGSTDTGGTGVAGYQYSKDGLTSWTDGSSIDISTPGTTCYYFRAVDNVSNKSSNSAQICALIDLTLPSATVGLSPSTWTNGTVIATITGSDQGGSLYKDARCKVGADGVWSAYATAPTCSLNFNASVFWEARDNANNTASGSSAVTNIATAGPTAPVVTASPAGWTNTGTVTLSASGSDDPGGSGILGYEHSLDGLTGWTAGASVDVSTEGKSCYYFRALDNAGNHSPASSEICAQIDRTNPTGTPSLAPASWTSGDVTFSITGTDTGSGYQDARCKNGTDGPFTAFSSTATCSFSANGTAYWETRDNAGNVASGSTDITKIDTTIPSTPTATVNPAGWTNIASVTLSAAGSTDPAGILSYQYSKDGLTGWTEGSSVSVTAAGTSCYVFRSQDNALNKSLNSNQVCAQIDRTNPAGVPSFTPSGWTTGVVTFQITGTDAGGSTYKDARCKAGLAGVWSDFGSSASCDFGSNGTAYWEVRDVAGNVASGTTNVTNIDTSKPTTPSVSASPAGWTSASSVVLSATGSLDTAGISKYQFSRDGVSSWTDGSSINVSDPGQTCYFFRSLDGAGNISDASSQICAKIDRENPTGSPSVSDSGWTNGVVSFTITGADTGGSGYNGARCKNGTSGTFTPWAASSQCDFATNGTAYWEVRDGAGNTISDSVDITTIDGTTPTTPTVSASPAGWTNAASVTLTGFSSTDAAGIAKYQYSPDGTSNWQDGSLLSVTSVGVHCYYFRSVDNAGNNSENSAQICAQIDRTVPTGSPSINPTDATNGIVVFSITGDDLGGSLYKDARCKVNSGSFSAYSPAASCNFTSNGTATWEVRDNAGNVTSGTLAITNIDSVLPTVPSVLASPSGWTNAAQVTLSASGSTDASGIKNYQLSADGTTNWTDGSSITISAAGSTCYFFRSIDNAGNHSTNSAQVCAQIDRIDPIAITSISPSGWVNGEVTFTISGSDNGGSAYKDARCKVGSQGVFSTWSSSSQCSFSTNDTAFFEIRDNAGNLVSGSLPIANIDAQIPTTPTVVASPAGWTNADKVTLTGSGSTDNGGVAKYQHSADGLTNWTDGDTLDITDPGETCYYFQAVDNAGNPSLPSSKVCAQIDRTNPVGTPNFTPSGWTNGSVSFSITGTDDGGSGYKDARCKVGTNGVFSAYQSTATCSVPSNDTVTWEVRDTAGNSISGSTDITNIDKTLPTTPSATASPAVWTSASSVTLSASGSSDIAGITKYQYSVTGTSGWTDGNTWTTSLTGSHCLYFRAIDGAGNASLNSAQVCALIDRSNPVGQPSLNPSSITNTDVTFSITGTDSGGASYKDARCKVGAAGTFTDWSSTAQCTFTSNGTAFWEVRDNALNVTPSTTSISNIDKTAPTGTPSINPSSWTTGNVTFTITGTDTGPSGYKDARCKVGVDGIFSAWSKTATCTFSDNGTAYWEVRDNIDNLASGSTDITNIDHSVPSTPVVSASPAGWTTAASVTLSASGSSDISGISGYQYSADGSTNWLDGDQVIVTDTGKTCYYFRALDNKGSTSINSSLICAQIDRSGPVEKITQAPAAGTWTNGNVNVSVSGTDTESGYQDARCKVGQSGSFTSWTSSSSCSLPDNGTVYWEIKDKVGNLASGQIDVANIDKVAPDNIASVAEAGSIPSNVWQGSNNAPSFSWSAATDAGGSGFAGYQVSWSTDSNGTGGSLQTATTFTPQPLVTSAVYYLRIRTKDVAGNYSAWNTFFILKFDNGAPNAPVVTADPAGWTNAASVTLTASGSTSDFSEVAKYQYSTTGNSNWQDGSVVTVSDPGQTCYYFRAVNVAGTGSSNSSRSCAQIDRTIPTGSPSLNPSGWTNQSVTFSITGNDYGSGSPVSRCKVGETGTFGTWANPSTCTVTDNAVVLWEVTDAAGNVATGSTNVTKIDKDSPNDVSSVTETSGTPDGVWQNHHNKPSFSWNAPSDPGGSGTALYYIYFGPDANGVNTSSPQAGTTYSPSTMSSPSVYYLRIRSKDAAGNTGNWVTLFNYKLDATAPAVPQISLNPSGWTSQGVTVTIQGDDKESGLDGSRCRIPGGNWTDWAKSSSCVVTANGLLDYEVRDMADNVKVGNYSINTIDTTSPGLPSDAVDSAGSLSGVWQSEVTAPAFTWAGSDSQSGVNGFFVYWGADASGTGTEYVTTASYSPAPVSSNGIYYLRLRTKDNVGNLSGWKTAYVFEYQQSAQITACDIDTDRGCEIKPSNTFSVTFGTGLVDALTHISYTEHDAPVHTLSDDFKALMSFSLSGRSGSTAVSQFKKQYTVSYTYNHDQIVGMDENSLQLAYWDEELQAWTNIPSTLNTSANTLVSTVDHFTDFIITGAASGVGNATITLQTGSLSVESSDISFGSVTLNGAPVTLPGTASPWRVTDSSGSGAGWRVMIQASDFESLQGKTIPAAWFKVSLNDASIARVSGNTKPTTRVTEEISLGATPQVVMGANPGEGMGVYDFAPSFSLIVPPSTFSGRYVSTVVTLVVSAP